MFKNQKLVTNSSDVPILSVQHTTIQNIILLLRQIAQITNCKLQAVSEM